MKRLYVERNPSVGHTRILCEEQHRKQQVRCSLLLLMVLYFVAPQGSRNDLDARMTNV